MRIALALCVVFAFCEVRAQTNVWQPSAGHTQMPVLAKRTP